MMAIYSSDPMSLALVCLLLLFVNNAIDTFIFYYGNAHISQTHYKGGYPSPVNGIVTLIEHDVKLFSHIRKVNPLTYKQYIELTDMEYNDEDYTHIAIFLNKFSHHIVINPETLLSAKAHKKDGTMVDMVENGKLLSDNSGRYLDNDALILTYPNSVVVLTLDKYVSEYLIGDSRKGNGAAIICRGSQCDIFVRGFESLKCSVGDKVDVYQTIIDNDDRVPMANNIESLINEGVEYYGGDLQLLNASLRNTLATFKNPVILSTFILGAMAYPFITPLSYVAFSWTYLFVCLRFYKHLMYALMNIIGYRKWMPDSYKLFNKITILWQKNKN